VPEARLKYLQLLSGVPAGTQSFREAYPALETPGYFQESLRDFMGGRLAAAQRSDGQGDGETLVRFRPKTKTARLNWLRKTSCVAQR
jgi:hypothetical protein